MDILIRGNMSKKTYVLDTSVYLTDFSSLKAFDNNDIIVPLKVLEEIDKHKKRQDGVGTNARQIIRLFDELRERGSLHDGVVLDADNPDSGLVYAKSYNPAVIPPDWLHEDADNKIIATALTEQLNNRETKVILVSRDINMRVKCDSINLQTQDYFDSQVVKSVDHVFTGFAKYIVEDREIDEFYDGDKIYIDGGLEDELYPNQFVMLVSEDNPKKTAITIFRSYEEPLGKVIDYKRAVWGIKPRNKEQNCALSLLMNPDIALVSLIGKAGSGKTLCAIAAGLQQTIEDAGKPVYSRLIVSRPIQPLGKDIGFLPGTMEEKMAPWLKPIEDNLKFLMGSDQLTLEMYMESGKIEIEALTYIRGRSISNAFIIIDEAQNLTQHELKTIITRVGEGTKIVLTGDVEQIDNIYIDEVTNGLTYGVEKLKDSNITGHITLRKGERSALATLAAKKL
jgi:PhoH-like ATPase